MPLSGKLFDTLWHYADIGARPEDGPEERVRKAVTSMTAIIIGFLAIFWGLTYVLLGYPFAGAIPLSYSVISAFSIGLYFRFKRFELFRFSQLLLILLLPFLLQWCLGGFSNGSIVMIWAFFTPLAVLLADGPRSGLRWLSGFLGLALVSGVLDPYLAAHVAPMPETARTVFFLLNIAVGLLSVYAVLNYFVKESRRYARQLRANEAHITELMMTDPLTGAANRRRLNQWLETQNRLQQWPLSIVAMDLDRFKSINDTYGHQVGDRVLQQLTNIARQCIHGQDMLARIGGEEFVVVLPQTPTVEACTIAERIRVQIEQTKFDGVERPVTASFGVGTTANGDLSDLLAHAGRALYHAKAGGRNRISTAPTKTDRSPKICDSNPV